MRQVATCLIAALAIGLATGPASARLRVDDSHVEQSVPAPQGFDEILQRDLPAYSRSTASGLTSDEAAEAGR